MNVAVQPAQTVTRSADDSSDDAVGLPGWIYPDPDFFELEKRSIFRTSWQLVCHGNDIPKVGDYHSLRSSRRIGRHRARQGWPAAQLPQRLPSSRIAPARRTEGQLRPAHRLPVSPWSYSLEGKLVGVPQRHRSAASTWRTTAWSRSSRKSSWASCSCASSRACRACARWRRRTR